ncbi:hypothetical protein B9Z19DRAFT_1137365 [Tuber borchii]|uniref:Uncharacterized protein n=1 Tax=Tuber borchii TaxID=42251 RepID=A0A2T6ZAL0_TUBBO|nr:hypothetical protein B9Z19DRAFT_1137365 [Tuber borchii]
MWLGFAKKTREVFVLNLYRTITRSLETQHSIWQERREGFMDDNDAIYPELQYQLDSDSHGEPARRRQTPIDALVRSLLMLVNLKSGFLDADPAGLEDRCRQTEKLGPENVRSPHSFSSLSLSLEDFEAGKASLGGGGNIQQDAEGGQEVVGIKGGN